MACPILSETRVADFDEVGIAGLAQQLGRFGCDLDCFIKMPGLRQSRGMRIQEN